MGGVSTDTTSTANEALSQALRTPLTSLTSYLSLLNRRVGAIAATHADDEALQRLAQLTEPALASALDMRKAIDEALDRHPTSPMGDFGEERKGWDDRLRRGETQQDLFTRWCDQQLAEMLAADVPA